MEKSDKFIIVLITIFIIIASIVLIIIKANNVNFKLGYLLLSIAGVIIVLSFFGYGFHFLFNKKLGLAEDKKEEKLPPAITVEEAREIAINAVKNKVYADYIIDCKGETSEHLGKNIKSLVYCYIAQGKYEDALYYVILNRHFPNQTISILIDPSDDEILRAKILSAVYPEEAPSVKKTRLENPMTGVVQTTEEFIKDKDEKEKAKEKDL